VDLAEKIQNISQKYQNDVRVVTIYVREAHSTDGWEIPQNRKNGVCYAAPRTIEARAKIVKDFIANTNFKLEIFLDQMDNRGSILYNSDPERVVVVDKNFRICFAGARGPFSASQEEVEQWLQKQLGY